MRHTGGVSNPYQPPSSPDPSGPDPYPAYGQPTDPYGPSGGYPGRQTQPYYQGAYGEPAADHPQGVLILVLGILGLLVAGILSPVAWVLGSRALKEINATGVHPRNESMIAAGRILGIIGTVVLVLAVLLGVALVVLFATAAATLGG